MEKLERNNKDFFTLLIGVIIGTFISIFIYSAIFIFSYNSPNNTFNCLEDISKLEKASKTIIFNPTGLSDADL